jgi:hypothetical protein
MDEQWHSVNKAIKAIRYLMDSQDFHRLTEQEQLKVADAYKALTAYRKEDQ